MSSQIFEQHPEWFDAWQEPAPFYREAMVIVNASPSVTLFNDPKSQQLLDAYIAARFAHALNLHEPCLLRLIRPERQFPDFQLRFEDRVEDYEGTEADSAGRRRGEEYLANASMREQGVEPEPELFDPTNDVLAAMEAIPRVIANKARKRYRPPPNLVVLVNPSSFDWPSGRDSELSRLTQPWCRDFQSIWVLWSLHCLRTWPTRLSLLVPTDEY